MRTLGDFDVKGKRVLVRCDFNIPLNEKKEITDDFKILQTLPTIKYLIEKGAKIILMSHLGRPAQNQKSKITPYHFLEKSGERQANQKFSLRPIEKHLEKLLKKKVKFLDDCIGEKVGKEVEKMRSEEIILLENLRFYKEEEENDENFAKELAKLGDIYINDAFGACHRAHASIVGVPKYRPAGTGFLLEKEINVLSKVLKNPSRPLIAIIGGVKISTKIRVIEQFLKTADHLLLGGKIFEPLLQVKEVLIGRPWLEEEIIEQVKKINLTDPKIHLPIDSLVCLPNLEEGYSRKAGIGSIRKEEEIFDIGPETIKLFSNLIKEAKMLVWSGPLGYFEREPFDGGSKAIAQAIVRNHTAFKIAGGGDTDAFLTKYNFRDKFDHVSTGGGAMLEFLSGEKLPGITALEKGESLSLRKLL